MTAWISKSGLKSSFRCCWINLFEKEFRIMCSLARSIRVECECVYAYIHMYAGDNGQPCRLFLFTFNLLHQIDRFTTEVWVYVCHTTCMWLYLFVCTHLHTVDNATTSRCETSNQTQRCFEWKFQIHLKFESVIEMQPNQKFLIEKNNQK